MVELLITIIGLLVAHVMHTVYNDRQKKSAFRRRVLHKYVKNDTEAMLVAHVVDAGEVDYVAGTLEEVHFKLKLSDGRFSFVVAANRKGRCSLYIDYQGGYEIPLEDLSVNEEQFNSWMNDMRKLGIRKNTFEKRGQLATRLNNLLKKQDNE